MRIQSQNSINDTEAIVLFKWPACSQTVGANLCQRHRVRENLSTDSSIAQTV